VLGSARFSIAAGRSVTLHVHLSAKGGALVRKAGKRGLKVTLTGSAVKTRTLVLKGKGRAKGHKKRRRKK
jgi:hypothetical protein